MSVGTELLKLKKLPNPGSAEAGRLGCTCPVIDNGRGRGFRGNPEEFVIVQGCPLHWPEKNFS
jgi:hypothetical protein